MCKRCWRIVPAHIRREVWTSYKAWIADVRDPAKLAQYKAAAAKACDAVAINLTAELAL